MDIYNNKDETSKQRPPNPYTDPPVSNPPSNNTDSAAPDSTEGRPSDAPTQAYQNPYLKSASETTAYYPASTAPAENPATSYPSGGQYAPNQYVQPLANPYAAANGPQNSGWPTFGATTPAAQTSSNPATQQRVLLGQRFNSQPRWTTIFLVIIGLCFAGQVLTGGLSERSYDWLVRYGAALEYNIRQGEWWRLLTPIFIHFGILHIAFNALALWSFGSQAERLFGTSRFIVLFFVTGIAGNVLPIFLENNSIPAAGASGSLFGLLGAMIGFFYRNRAEMGNWAKENLRGLLITAVLNFVITLSIPNVGHFAHLGGLLAGIFLGYFLSPLHIKRTIGKGAQVATVRLRDFVADWWSVGALIIILAVLLFITFQGPLPPPNRFIPGTA